MFKLKARIVARGFQQLVGINYWHICTYRKMVHYKINIIHNYQKKMESNTNGREDKVSKQTFEWRGLHGNP
jgi:hypothetical protein